MCAYSSIWYEPLYWYECVGFSFGCWCKSVSMLYWSTEMYIRWQYSVIPNIVHVMLKCEMFTDIDMLHGLILQSGDNIATPSVL